MRHTLRFLVLTALAFVLRAFAAPGDIISVTIPEDGWYADVKVEGLGTGGTFASGLGSNNDPDTGTPKITFTVVSLSFDDAGNSTTITRTVYGTAALRFPYSSVSIAGSYTSGTFAAGETITQATSGATATALFAQSAGGLLYAKVVTGTPNSSSVWTGGTSGATFTPTATPTTLTLPTSWTSYDGTNTTVRIALSDYIYAKDNTGGGNSGTAPVVNILSGAYTYSGTPNNASGAGFPVTNNSTLNYRRAIANWSLPGNNLLGSSFEVRAVAFHGDGQQGRPVRCVKFWATDGTNTTPSVFATVPTVKNDLGDAMPVCEYIATLDGSGLTQGATVTIHFAAYPWVGDSAATMDTSDGVNTAPTPLYAPQYGVCDKNGTYGASYAVVDPTFANDSSGVVYSTQAAAVANAATTAYKTQAGAFNALRTYNNTNYSRNNCGGSHMLMRSTGTHTWVNGSVTLGTTPATWLTVEAFPGDSMPVIGNKGTGASLGLKVKISGCKLTGTDATGTISAGASSYLWLDRCEINSASGVPIYLNTCWYFTSTLVTNMAQGLRPGGSSASPALIRGCDIRSVGASWIVYTALGNKHSAARDIRDNASITPVPALIFAYNRVQSSFTTSAAFRAGEDNSNIIGMAVVGNTFERVDSANQALVRIAGDSSTTDNINNVILWYNTLSGQRWNIAYNDNGSTSRVRALWSVKNNITEDHNIKSDIFTTANGNRIGNWSQLFGVSWSGNCFPEVTGIGAPGQFVSEFNGIKTYIPTLTTLTSGQNCNTSTLTALAFVNRAAWTGSVVGSGNGDYKLNTASIANGFQRDWVLPFDLAGNPRGQTAPTGAYTQFVQSIATTASSAMKPTVTTILAK